MNDDLLAILEQANPVPDPEALLAEPDDARRFEALVASRRQQPGVGAASLGMPLRRGLLVAAAAAAVVLLVGSVFLFVDRTRPEDAVEPAPPSLVTTPEPVPTTAPPAPTTSPPATEAPEPATVGAAPFQDGLSLALFTDEEYTEPGGAVFHDGEWHLFYRTVNWDDYFTGAAILGWATSDDGRRFARRADLGTMEELGVQQGIQVTDAIVLADGTWALYYHTLLGPSRGEVIWRMTAPGPGGPWTPDAAPVLEPGPPGTWDESTVAFGDVVAVGDEYWMFYDGLDAAGRRSIGVATSPDGVTFERRPEPVLVAEEEWEVGVVFDPSVVVTDEGFVMTYLSRGLRDASELALYAVGLASSDDGLTWVKHPANPIFEHDQAGFNYTGVSTLLHTPDAYVWLGDLESGRGVSVQYDASAWHLVHEGPLRP